jgi:WD40 repeat protein
VVAFSPDGRLLASGHVDGVVHLWDLDRGMEIPVRMRHDGAIGDVVFSPDGAILVSGAHDATIKFWDVRAAWTGDARRVLYRQPSAISALAFAGGSTWLVTGHVNRVLRVLDVASGRLVATLRGPESAITQIRTSPDGRAIAVASQDRFVRVFDLAEKRQITSVESPRRPPSGIAFFGSSSALASVAHDNVLNLWDLDRGGLLASLWGAKQERFVSVFLPEEETSVAVLLADGRIRLWSRIR